MKIVRTANELASYITEAKQRGKVGFVPTMGALHCGHISLVDRCVADNCYCVVSLFVNPTQFNDPKDLERYPRTESEDAKMLEEAKCDILFIPSTEEIYPQEDTREFDFGGLDRYMEGPSRPGHFKGVAQVVTKLFDIVNPDKAYFGEKDFQQLAIISWITKELALPIDIVGCPIMRAEDGLALSSRNMLLSDENRQRAPHIYSVLKKSLELSYSMDIKSLEQLVIEQINTQEGMEVEYFIISNATTLSPATDWDEQGGVVGCITVRFGGVRLIDNIKYR